MSRSSSTRSTATATARCTRRCASSWRPGPTSTPLLIATGDRWHATATIMAMRAGKDVYSEKPSCMTIAEGRAVVQTARRYGRIYQTGTQRLSEANFVAAIEMARTGRLGKVHTVRAHIAPWDAAEMSHAWLPARAATDQGRGRLGRLARSLSLAALQLGLRPRRLARSLRLPHELHRRVGRAHLRPVAGGHRRAQHLGDRIPLRQEPHRRRHGHQVRQRRADDPPARRLARLVRHEVRGDRGLGRDRRRLREARGLVPVAAGRRRQARRRVHRSGPAGR